MLLKIIQVNAREGVDTLYSTVTGTRDIKGYLFVYSGLRSGNIMVKGPRFPLPVTIGTQYKDNKILLYGFQDFRGNKELGQIGTEPIIHICIAVFTPKYLEDQLIIFDFESKLTPNEVQLFIGGLYKDTFTVQGRELIELVVEPTPADASPTNPHITHYIFRPVYPRRNLFFYSATIYRWVQLGPFGI